jgi:hypothetical protein
MFRIVVAALSLGALTLVAGCSQPADKAPAQAAPAEASLPTVDLAVVQARLSPDETPSVVEFPRTGSRIVTGQVTGYKTQVWIVPVAAGQTLTVAFAPSNTNLYVNILDADDDSGLAVHRGEVDGPRATLAAVQDAVFIIRPFQPRATARRNETGDYTLTIDRS